MSRLKRLLEVEKKLKDAPASEDNRRYRGQVQSEIETLWEHEASDRQSDPLSIYYDHNEHH